MCKKLFTYCALMLLLTLCPMLASAQQGPGAAAFREAETARRNNQLDAAITGYQKAISLEGTNYKYYARMGTVYAQQKKYKEAKAAFEKAVEINPAFTSGLLFIAKLAMKEQDFATALTYINRAFEAEQDQGKKLQYKLLAVKLLIKQNQPQQAQAELQKAKAIAPNDIRVITAEGDVYTALGNYQAAAASYESALSRLGPNPAPAEKGKILLGLAVAKHKSGDQAGASQMAETQLKPLGAPYRQFKYLTSGQAQRFLVLAKGYMSANMFKEAMEYVNKAIEAGDKNNVSYKMQGMLYFKQGQMQQAIMAFDKAATAETDAAKRGGIYKLMVKLQFGAQMYRETVATADKILGATPSPDQPTKASLNLMKAQSFYQLGQYQAAIEAARAGMGSVVGEPQQAVYQFIIGMSAKKAGDVAAAKVALEKAQLGAAFKFAAKQELASLTSN